MAKWGARLKQRLRTTFTKFKSKAFVVRSMEEQKDRTASGAEMHKVLGPFDLVMLGIGCIIGAGVFVLTGVAARKYAGPGVVLSYALSALTAMLTAFCYAEYAAELPVAGGAFNYISMTYGEFAAWVTACDLILEYTLSAAAVAKGFTSYMAALIGVNIKYLRLQFSVFTLDFPAALAVVAMSFILMRSTAESSLFNVVVSGLNVALILFVLGAGFPHAHADNYEPFMPFGLQGVFTGASVVFFSFIGFDTVATAAEEVRNPGRDLPIGIVGSLSICTVLYVAMCLAITGMESYTTIDLDAPFAVAFAKVGMGWAQRLVAAGALTGIITSLLGSLLGQARIYVTLGRQALAPAWLARVHPTRGTPRNATLVTMCTAGFLALFIDIELLAELVSIGTLVVFCSVCSGVLFRRYHVHGSGEPLRPLALRLGGVIATAIGFSLSFTERAPVAVPVIFLVLWLAVTASFVMLPVRYTPQVFRCPGSPFLPSLGMLATLHLIGSLGWPAYVRWVVWFTLGTAVYLSYGVHKAQVGPDAPGAIASANNGLSDRSNHHNQRGRFSFEELRHQSLSVSPPSAMPPYMIRGAGAKGSRAAEHHNHHHSHDHHASATAHHALGIPRARRGAAASASASASAVRLRPTALSTIFHTTRQRSDPALPIIAAATSPTATSAVPGQHPRQSTQQPPCPILPAPPAAAPAAFPPMYAAAIAAAAAQPASDLTAHRTSDPGVALNQSFIGDADKSTDSSPPPAGGPPGIDDGEVVVSPDDVVTPLKSAAHLRIGGSGNGNGNGSGFNGSAFVVPGSSYNHAVATAAEVAPGDDPGFSRPGSAALGRGGSQHNSYLLAYGRPYGTPVPEDVELEMSRSFRTPAAAVGAVPSASGLGSSWRPGSFVPAGSYLSAAPSGGSEALVVGPGAAPGAGVGTTGAGTAGAPIVGFGERAGLLGSEAMRSDGSGIRSLAGSTNGRGAVDPSGASRPQT